MKISTVLQSPLSYQQVLLYRQRLIAMLESFDADLVLCLAGSESGWSLVAWEGSLARGHWQERLPYRALDSSLCENGSALTVDSLGKEQNASLFAVISVSPRRGLLFVACKPLTKGVYRGEDVTALERFLAAFENAGA